MIYFPLIMPRLLFDYFLVVDFSLIRGFYRGLSFDVNSLTDNFSSTLSSDHFCFANSIVTFLLIIHIFIVPNKATTHSN